MPFSAPERETLLAAYLVGPTVVQRLEEAGFHDLATLARADARAICIATATALGSNCWSNSPRAQQAIENAITAARGA